MRVTLSIPKNAASKLRQLAAEGNTALRALGILSVQLEGDTVISLRLVGQEIVIRTGTCHYFIYVNITKYVTRLINTRIKSNYWLDRIQKHI